MPPRTKSKPLAGRGLAVAFLAGALLRTMAGASEGGGFDFQFDIAPILARHGCAAADCHGGATGRGGFKLSLFATEPESDYWALTQELHGRRIDRRDPQNSLVLLKAARQLKHGGGRVLEIGGEAYHRLRDWIADGAPYQLGQTQTLKDLVFSGDRVEAIFENGTGAHRSRDVTSMARFSSTNSDVAAVDENGLVERRGPGRAWILAAYGGLSTRKPIVIPFAGDLAVAAESPASVDAIDRAWLQGLRQLGLTPEPPPAPRQLVRRLYLDLAGRIPSPLEVREFLEDDDAQRTANAARKLVESMDFVEAWTPWLHAWFEVSPPSADAGPNGDREARLRARLRSWMIERRPLTDLAAEVLAMGETKTTFVGRYEDPRDRAEFAGRTLLGISIGCARCHNHPHDRWRQSQHLQFSALFSDPRPDPSRPDAMTAGMFFLPGENRPVPPALLPIGDEQGLARNGEEPRDETLKAFVLESARKVFARNVANRIFGRLTGRHLVEAPDDHRLTNPPSDPALLDVLASELSATGFDLRAFVQRLVTSKVYQLGSGKVFVAGDPAYRYLARREAGNLTDEQWRRSVEQALGVPIPRREAADSPLTRQLALLNDSLLHDALNTPGNQVEAVFDFETDPGRQLEILSELILSRPPEPAEIDAFLPVIREADDPVRAGKELAHAWFLSREFGSHR